MWYLSVRSRDSRMLGQSARVTWRACKYYSTIKTGYMDPTNIIMFLLVFCVTGAMAVDRGRGRERDGQAGTRNLEPKLKEIFGAPAARRQNPEPGTRSHGGAEPEPRNPVPGRTGRAGCVSS